MLLKKNWQPFTAGYGEQQVLEIILGFKKVISNYTNHIANTLWMELSKNSLGKIIKRSSQSNYLGSLSASVPTFVWLRRTKELHLSSGCGIVQIELSA
jgi:hypothetical protein